MYEIDNFNNINVTFTLINKSKCSFSALSYVFYEYYYRESLSQSLVRHVQCARTKTVKKLVSLPQVDVNYCDVGETPIMCVGWYGVSDEQCCELYDVLIQAGALNYSKSDELVYV